LLTHVCESTNFRERQKSPVFIFEIRIPERRICGVKEKRSDERVL